MDGASGDAMRDEAVVEDAIERVMRDYEAVYGELPDDLRDRVRQAVGVLPDELGGEARVEAAAAAWAAVASATRESTGSSVSSPRGWSYRLDGVGTAERVKPRAAGPVGRNDPCPCGSGRKFKACCRGRTPFEVSLEDEVAVDAAAGGGEIAGG